MTLDTFDLTVNDTLSYHQIIFMNELFQRIPTPTTGAVDTDLVPKHNTTSAIRQCFSAKFISFGGSSSYKWKLSHKQNKIQNFLRAKITDFLCPQQEHSLDECIKKFFPS